MTPLGWGMATIGLGVTLLSLVLFAYPFLAPTQPVAGEILVVEGWLPDYALEKVKDRFANGQYKLVVLICEDQWVDGPISNLTKFDIDMVISINASPFQQDKSLERLDLCKKYASSFGVEYIYVNLVGGQDEIVFDGGSFVLDANGSVVNQLPSFEEYSCHHNIPNLIVETESTENAIYSALVLATKDYVQKNI